MVYRGTFFFPATFKKEKLEQIFLSKTTLFRHFPLGPPFYITKDSEEPRKRHKKNILRCFNVYKTSMRRRRRLLDVENTSRVYWEGLS